MMYGRVLLDYRGDLGCGCMTGRTVAKQARHAHLTARSSFKKRVITPVIDCGTFVSSRERWGVCACKAVRTQPACVE